MRDGVEVEYGVVDILPERAQMDPKEMKEYIDEEIHYLIATPSQLLHIYFASSQDSYRNDRNKHKVFAKIVWLKLMQMYQ